MNTLQMLVMESDHTQRRHQVSGSGVNLMFLPPFTFHPQEGQNLMEETKQAKRLLIAVTGLEGQKTH